MKASLSRFPTWQDVQQWEETFLSAAHLSERSCKFCLTGSTWLNFGMYFLIRKLHLENDVWAVHLVNK